MGTYSNFTGSGNTLTHISGAYRVRRREERRCWEVEFRKCPNIWTTTGTKKIEEVEQRVSEMLSVNGVKTVTGMKFKDFARNFYSRTDDNSIYMHNIRMKKYYEPSWYEQNESRLRNYILPKFGDMDIRMITDVMIEDWYTSLRSHRYDGSELADNTKIKTLQTLKYIMKEAKRRRLIETNPCDTVERIKEEHKKRGFFSPVEISLMFPEDRDRLLAIWKTMQNALFFSIMVDTGWRCGEVSALRKQNFIDGGVYSTCSVDFRTGRIKNSIKTSKKGQDYKVGILSDYTMELYDEYRKELGRDELFYIESQGKMNTPYHSNFVLKRALEYLGIPEDGRTGHCLRHSFDTYMLNNTGDLVSHDDVLELMAHTSYRPEYDHRSETDIIKRLMKAKPLLNDIRRQA